MTFDEQINRYADASEQAASTPSGCKACQRTGLPVFPLRVAAVPKALVNSGWKPVVPQQDAELTGGEFKYALRTLRMGYLYVLLDRRIWQGYQVTAEGYLRQFDPLAMPEGDGVEPISRACREQGHCINASFINIDDKKYGEAWLAFSSDPWSKAVLAGYKSGARPDSRFTKVSLAALKESPASVPEALVIEPSLASLKASVAEFATTLFINTERVTGERSGGAHGFYPRQESASALGLKVSQLGVQYRCPITALALNDEVGVVQELNNGRLQIVEATRLYIEQPAIFHRHIISESVIQYLDKIKADIAAVSQPRVGFNGPAIGGKGPKPMSKEEAAAETFAKQYARLLKSYDEPARAAFAKQFEYRLASSQERIETIDKDLAAWYQAESWLKTITYDYAPDSSAVGWDAQMKTIAGCVQGGAMSKATEDVWLVWLKKPDSPAYLGFTGMNTSLLGAVFSGANVFGNLKTAATIDEFGMYLKGKALRQGWAARILAVSASVSRLGRAVDAATRKGYLAMTQAAMLTAGESIVMVRYQTTLRKLKRKLKYDAALRQALAKNNITFEKSGIEGLRGGSAVVVDELMGIRGKALDTPVIIEQSLPGTLEEIRAKLPGINVTKAPFNNPAMLGDIEELFISDLSLQGKGTTGPVVRASYAQLAAWNERGMRLISGDSAGLIMGAGLMALQMANWTDLIDRLHTSVGTDLDVIADISISNLLFIEGFSELSGFAWKLMIKQNWVVLSKAQQVPGPVRFGAVLGGIAAIVDGFRNWIHALKSFNAGDYAAGGYYTASALAALVGGGIGAGYGFAGNFAFTSARFLGPVGWAAVLIIAGIMLAYRASELRTTAFEKWLRRTCFGLRDHNFTGVVWNADSLDDLAEAVVEYRAIRSGMVADVAFASALDIFTGNPTVQSEDYCRVDFRVSMPGWVKGSGGWSLTLTGNNRQLFSQSDSAPGLDDHYQLTGPEGYYKYQLRVDGEAGADENAEGPQTLSIMVSVWVVKNGTPEVTLVAEYWPDKAEPEYKLGLTINAKQD